MINNSFIVYNIKQKFDIIVFFTSLIRFKIFELEIRKLDFFSLYTIIDLYIKNIYINSIRIFQLSNQVQKVVSQKVGFFSLYIIIDLYIKKYIYKQYKNLVAF